MKEPNGSEDPWIPPSQEIRSLFEPIITESTENIELNEDDFQKLPSTLAKILTRMDNLKRDLAVQKKQLADTHTEIKAINTLLFRYSKKCIKIMDQNVSNSKRRPRGFACPSKVSDELCDFMGKPRGTKISRTETSSFLSQYIAANGLQDPQRKSVIIPDTKLIQLFGEDAIKSGDDLNYFNMQKHITPHFLK